MPSFNDQIPLLHNHELRNKKFLIEGPTHNMAFVGQQCGGSNHQSNSGGNKNFYRSDSKQKGQYQNFSSKGKGFVLTSTQAGPRKPQINAEPSQGQIKPQEQCVEQKL